MSNKKLEFMKQNSKKNRSKKNSEYSVIETPNEGLCFKCDSLESVSKIAAIHQMARNAEALIEEVDKVKNSKPTSSITQKDQINLINACIRRVKWDFCSGENIKSKHFDQVKNLFTMLVGFLFSNTNSDQRRFYSFNIWGVVLTLVTKLTLKDFENYQRALSKIM